MTEESGPKKKSKISEQNTTKKLETWELDQYNPIAGYLCPHCFQIVMNKEIWHYGREPKPVYNFKRTD